MFGKIKPTAAEARHMGRVKAMKCVCCTLMGMAQTSETDIHHVRQGGEPRNHMLILPLCHAGCHQGPLGVHGTGRFLAILKMSEWALLGVVYLELYA